MCRRLHLFQPEYSISKGIALFIGHACKPNSLAAFRVTWFRFPRSLSRFAPRSTSLYACILRTRRTWRSHVWNVTHVQHLINPLKRKCINQFSGCVFSTPERSCQSWVAPTTPKGIQKNWRKGTASTPITPVPNPNNRNFCEKMKRRWSLKVKCFL